MIYVIFFIARVCAMIFMLYVYIFFYCDEKREKKDEENQIPTSRSKSICSVKNKRKSSEYCNNFCSPLCLFIIF